MKKRSGTALFGAGVLALTIASGLLIGDTGHYVQVASTVPSNGDLNPYGVAMVPRSMGNLVEGHFLVSNFNNSANQQGTGTTIVDVAPNGTTSLFAQINAATLPGPCPGGVGLTTALVVLRAGWVIVGSLPTTNGNASTAQSGCLIVLDSKGNVVETLANNLINGPWDMTALDLDTRAYLFVTNVLNGTVAGNGNVVYGGTVVRLYLSTYGLMPQLQSMSTIGAGFPEETNAAALVIGPTGVGLGPDGTLYVADTLDNRIAAIKNAVDRTTSAGTGTTLIKGGSLNGPLGVAISPYKYNLLITNGDTGTLLEVTPAGQQVMEMSIAKIGNPPGGGALFGLAPSGNGLYFVNDDTNTLNVLPGGGNQ
jgi:DNA-binding beta-propeller fold protein YncE